MNANAKKWIEVLRSGKFKQGKEKLQKNDNTFCCLGVACELYRQSRKKGFIKWENVEGQEYKTFVIGEKEKNYNFLPKRVMKWLGMTSDRGIIRAGLALYALNDDGKSFLEIADIIEENQDNLFKV